MYNVPNPQSYTGQILASQKSRNWRAHWQESVSCTMPFAMPFAAAFFWASAVMWVSTWKPVLESWTAFMALPDISCVLAQVSSQAMASGVEQAMLIPCSRVHVLTYFDLSAALACNLSPKTQPPSAKWQ